MNIDLYDVVYTLGNLFMAFVIHKFMYIFYNESQANAVIEKLCYFSYFIVITVVHTTIRIPVIVAETNLLLIFLLSFFYSRNFRKNLLSTFLIYIVLTCAETLTVFLTSFIRIDILSPYEYNSVLGIITIRIVCYVIVLLLGNFKNIKAGKEIPRIYWISLFVVPFGTVLLLFSTFMGVELPVQMTAVNIAAVLLINLTSFYLYDSISRLMAERMRQCVLEQQNKYYEKQLDLMRDVLNATKMLRHDMKNKLSPIYELAKSGNHQELIQQLSSLTDFCTTEKEYSNTGNNAIDSILNFKLQQAKREGVEVTCNVKIPSDLPLSPFDVAVILGNLLDNAIEGNRNLAFGKMMEVYIKFSKGRLIITISNSFDGIVLHRNDAIVSRKSDSNKHGLGIQSVQQTVQKYNGAVDIQHSDHIFTVKVLMYIETY